MSRSIWKGPFIDYFFVRKNLINYNQPNVSKKQNNRPFRLREAQSPKYKKKAIEFGGLRAAQSNGSTTNGTTKQKTDRTQETAKQSSNLTKLPIQANKQAAFQGSRRPITIWSRRSMVLPDFIGKDFLVNNGQNFIRLRVTQEMIGHRFGEFASTRRKANHEKKDKKKRRK